MGFNCVSLLIVVEIHALASEFYHFELIFTNMHN